jgi:hypothetical protein
MEAAVAAKREGDGAEAKTSVKRFAKEAAQAAMGASTRAEGFVGKTEKEIESLYVANGRSWMQEESKKLGIRANQGSTKLARQLLMAEDRIKKKSK